MLVVRSGVGRLIVVSIVGSRRAIEPNKALDHEDSTSTFISISEGYSAGVDLQGLKVTPVIRMAEEEVS